MDFDKLMADVIVEARMSERKRPGLKRPPKEFTLWVKYEGDVMPFLTACKRIGVPYITVYSRVFRGGWPLVRAFEGAEVEWAVNPNE